MLFEYDIGISKPRRGTPIEDVRHWSAILPEMLNTEDAESPVVELLKSMLQLLPSERPSAQECLNHRYFLDSVPAEGDAISCNSKLQELLNQQRRQKEPERPKEPIQSAMALPKKVGGNRPNTVNSSLTQIFRLNTQ